MQGDILHLEIQPKKRNLMTTTQNAPLERLLNKLRASKVKKYTLNKTVLDFGCGKNAWTTKHLFPTCKTIVGFEPSLIGFKKEGPINIYNSLDQIKEKRIKFEAIIALAVFEHIKPLIFRNILKELGPITTDDAVIAGTVPRPEAKPILEFLSLKMKLIDASQIRDHKVYYDELWLKEMLEGTGWRLDSYKKFQLGLNSTFVFKKS